MAQAGYLDKLNDKQRAAVEFGVGGETFPPPLLVIAGAGSGKTNTLAHRVAHLLVNGADPRRILLMTFSRRAATELTRRVERITAQAMGTSVAAEALTWAGTFHGIGARILREHALSIGLHPDFSIHDREDSADLMNLTRHGIGFSETESRFPAKGTCLAIYSRAVNAETSLTDVLRDHFPWCAPWQAERKQLFGAYVQAKQAQNVLDYDDLLLAWTQVMADPDFAAHIGATWDHVLIDEYMRRMSATAFISCSQPRQMLRSFRRDDSVLGQVSAQRVDRLGALCRKKIARLQNHGLSLALRSLHGDKAHRGARYRFGVGSIAVRSTERR